MMEQKRRNKRTVAIFLVLSILMTSSLSFFAFSPAVEKTAVRIPQYVAAPYVNNKTREIIGTVTGMEIAKVLPFDGTAPQNPPKKENYELGKDGKDSYRDSTIEVTCWKERFHGFKDHGSVTVSFAEVKIKHASQFRRQWANGDYNSTKYQYPSNMFKRSNGVVGMAADFYKHRKYGIIVQYGTVICNKRGMHPLYVLVIDYDGNFQIWNDSELAEKIEKEGADDIMLSFTFGPALVENGQAVDPKNWKGHWLGELNDVVGRAAIGQLGDLHYLMCTVGRPGMTCEEVSKVMEQKGCRTAYNLDGGQSGTLLFNRRVYNEITYKGVERAMSDILYFCSAE